MVRAAVSAVAAITFSRVATRQRAADYARTNLPLKGIKGLNAGAGVVSQTRSTEDGYLNTIRK